MKNVHVISLKDLKQNQLSREEMKALKGGSGGDVVTIVWPS